MPQLRDKVPDEVGGCIQREHPGWEPARPLLFQLGQLGAFSKLRWKCPWIPWVKSNTSNTLSPFWVSANRCAAAGCLAGLLLPFASSPACLGRNSQINLKTSTLKKQRFWWGLWAWAILLGAQLVVSWVDSYIPKWPTLKPFQRSSSGWNLKAAPLHSFVGRRTAHFGSSGIGSSQCLCPSDLTAGIHQVVVAKIHKGLPTNRPA